jgi:hypothetical protein
MGLLIENVRTVGTSAIISIESNKVIDEICSRGEINVPMPEGTNFIANSTFDLDDIYFILADNLCRLTIFSTLLPYFI